MSIDEHFRAFHQANPQVYERLEAIALELWRAGRAQISMRDLWGYIRIERLRVVSQDGYKLNNNHISRFSRLLLERHPALANVIELREIKGGEAPKSWHEEWMDRV